MTVTVNDRRWGPVSGDGSTTAFDTDFEIVDDSDAIVEVYDTTLLTLTTKTLTTDYTISAKTSAGFRVNFVNAPASDEKVIVRAAEPITQAVDFDSQSSFPAEANESALDKITRILQDAKEQLARVALLSPIDPTLEQLVIPDRTGNAGKGLILANDLSLGWGTEVASLVAGTDYLTPVQLNASYVAKGLNIAAIQAQTWTTVQAPDIVEVACRVSLGDGGGGKFAYDSADTSSSDDGALIIVTASGRRYKRVIESADFISAWWGTDFAALQSAVDAAIANERPLFVTQVARAIGAAEKLTIDGPLTMYSSDTSTAILQASADRSIPVIEVTGASADDVTLKRLKVESTFSGAPTALQTNAGIVFDGVEDARLEDVEVEGRFYVGVMYKDCTKYGWKGLAVRGARNRLVYVNENCLDGNLSDLRLDGRNSAGAEYSDYGLNINPGNDSPRRLTVDGVTCRGCISHGVSIAGDFEQWSISNIVGETDTATAIGFLLQGANGDDARRGALSNIIWKGGLVPIYLLESFYFTANGLVGDRPNGAAAYGTAGVRIQDCIHASFGVINVNNSPYDGVLVRGTAAGLCNHLTFGCVNTTVCGNDGMAIVSDVTNAVQHVTVGMVDSLSATGTGFSANADSAHIRLLGFTGSGNGTQIDNAASSAEWVAAGGDSLLNLLSIGAEDTTLSRSAAGVIAVEGGVVPKENRANTFSAAQKINLSADNQAFFSLEAAAVGRLIVGTQASGHTTMFTQNSKQLHLGVGSAQCIMTGTLFQIGNNTEPSATEFWDLGSASKEWDNIYTQNAVTVSDARRKNDLGEIDPKQAGDFLKALPPRFFSFKPTVIPEHTIDEWVDVEVLDEATGKKKVIPQAVERTVPAHTIQHGRPHAGFFAQDVKAALDAAGIEDCAVYAYEEEHDTHVLRLAEMHALQTAVIRDLLARVESLERYSHTR